MSSSLISDPFLSTAPFQTEPKKATLVQKTTHVRFPLIPKPTPKILIPKPALKSLTLNPKPPLTLMKPLNMWDVRLWGFGVSDARALGFRAGTFSPSGLLFGFRV